MVLDTHIWFWWVQDEPRLSAEQRRLIAANESTGLGVSVMSCWEIALLIAKKRLTLSDPIDVWMNQALRYPGIRLLALTAEIAVASTCLPGEFHPDPADRIIVATARAHNCSLVTVDSRILRYPHVQLAVLP